MKFGYNSFTKDCDKYLTNGYELDKKYPFVLGTYLWNEGLIEVGNNLPFGEEDNSNDCFVVFRVPGATRGHIEIDGNTMVITDIIFYDTCFAYKSGQGCYKKQVLKLREKYVGTIYCVDEVKEI